MDINKTKAVIISTADLIFYPFDFILGWFAMLTTKPVIVVGYPKSGNTWCARLVAELIGCPVQGFWGELQNPDIAREGHDRPRRYEVFKAHQQYDGLCRVGPFFRMIYIVRDPRDVVCSGAHFFNVRQYNSANGTDLGKYQAMVKTVTEGGIYPHCNISWAEHVAQYRNSGALIVRYEDLLQDGIGQLQRIADHVGIERSKQELQRVWQAQSFSAVKARSEQKGDQRNVNFLRRGKHGSYHDELTPAQIAEVEDHCGPMMRELGYL